MRQLTNLGRLIPEPDKIFARKKPAMLGDHTSEPCARTGKPWNDSPLAPPPTRTSRRLMCETSRESRTSFRVWGLEFRELGVSLLRMNSVPIYFSLSLSLSRERERERERERAGGAGSGPGETERGIERGTVRARDRDQTRARKGEREKERERERGAPRERSEVECLDRRRHRIPLMQGSGLLIRQKWMC